MVVDLIYFVTAVFLPHLNCSNQSMPQAGFAHEMPALRERNRGDAALALL
jgi:hypothetical protein